MALTFRSDYGFSGSGNTGGWPKACRQAQALHEGLAVASRASELIAAEGLNHFEISRTLADPSGLLFGAAMRMIAAAGRVET